MPRSPVVPGSFPWAAALLAAACASAPRVRSETPVPVVRRGADRAAPSYAERFPEAKARLLARLNEERRAAGAPPVAYDLLAARVGDAFCLDTARTRSSGHWDTAGRPPYLRWGLAGGVDYHAENFGSLTRTGADVEETEVPALLLDAHARMMAEVPPGDGHRRTVLDPEWTHVGIGVAVVGRRVPHGGGIQPARRRMGRGAGAAASRRRACAVRREAARGMDARLDRGRIRGARPAHVTRGDRPPRGVRVSPARRRASSPARPRTPSIRTARAARSASCMAWLGPTFRSGRARATTTSSSTRPRDRSRGAGSRLSRRR